MSETKEEVVEQPTAPEKFVFAGQEFNSRDEAEAWANSLKSTVGRQGMELGDLRKFKTFVEPTKSERELLQEVQALREEGDDAKADQLLIGYVNRRDSEYQMQIENDRFWNNYAKARANDLGLDADLMRTYVESKPDVAKALAEQADQAAFLDEMFGRLVKRQKFIEEAEPLAPSKNVPDLPQRAGKVSEPTKKTSEAPKPHFLESIFLKKGPFDN